MNFVNLKKRFGAGWIVLIMVCGGLSISVCLSLSIISWRSTSVDDVPTSPSITQKAAPPLTQQTASPTAMEKMQKISTEWEKEKQKEALLDTQTTKQFRKVVSDWENAGRKDFLDFAQRMISVSESKPDDAGARDALVWIISSDIGIAPGPEADIKERAVQMLLQYHANDPDVARSTLILRIPSTNRDTLLNGLVAKATNHEAQGLARIALARYLKSKTRCGESFRTGPQNNLIKTLYGDAYLSHLCSCDLVSMRQKTERLLEELVADFGDVPFVRSGSHGAVDLLRKKSLAQTAESLLDEIRNLAIGKPAPAIEGVDLNGQPLSLSAFRGKVVVLVFWASWCGPCMADVSHERKLVEQLSDKPFTLVGVNCDVDNKTARKSVEAAQINWANWHDGFPAPTPGPIVDRYHVHSFPAVFVLDANGVIRSKGSHGERLAETVHELLAELDTKRQRVSRNTSQSIK